MKRIIILIVLVLVSANSFAQKFILSELVKMTSMNWDDFDTYIVSKGYLYESHERDGDITISFYDMNVNSIHKSYRYNNSDRAITKCPNTISYQTSKKEEYLAIKNQLKTMGFKFIKSGVTLDDVNLSDNNDASLFYQKGNLELSLVTTKATLRGVTINKTVYVIVISKPNR